MENEERRSLQHILVNLVKPYVTPEEALCEDPDCNHEHCFRKPDDERWYREIIISPSEQDMPALLQAAQLQEQIRIRKLLQFFKGAAIGGAVLWLIYIIIVLST